MQVVSENVQSAKLDLDHHRVEVEVDGMTTYEAWGFKSQLAFYRRLARDLDIPLEDIYEVARELKQRLTKEHEAEGRVYTLTNEQLDFDHLVLELESRYVRYEETESELVD